MSAEAIIHTYKVARELASRGVEYTSRNGAVCPFCGKPRMKTYSSPPWRDEVKIRYHRCKNPDCLLFKLALSVKSTELGEKNEAPSCEKIEG